MAIGENLDINSKKMNIQKLRERIKEARTKSIEEQWKELLAQMSEEEAKTFVGQVEVIAKEKDLQERESAIKSSGPLPGSAFQREIRIPETEDYGQRPGRQGCGGPVPRRYGCGGTGVFRAGRQADRQGTLLYDTCVGGEKGSDSGGFCEAVLCRNAFYSPGVDAAI